MHQTPTEITLVGGPRDGDTYMVDGHPNEFLVPISGPIDLRATAPSLYPEARELVYKMMSDGHTYLFDGYRRPPL